MDSAGPSSRWERARERWEREHDAPLQQPSSPSSSSRRFVPPGCVGDCLALIGERLLGGSVEGCEFRGLCRGLLRVLHPWTASQTYWGRA